MSENQERANVSLKSIVDINTVIIEYWFKLVTNSSLSFDDISKIIIAFGKEYEEFDALHSHKSAKIESDGKIGTRPQGASGGCAMFGKFTANPGRAYHWTLKVVHIDDYSELNIGIIEADLVITKKYRTDWWNDSCGYSYFAEDGYAYNNGWKEYGDAYGKGDVIDVWLDLKDKYELSFAKNDKAFGKAFNMKQSTDYKLAIGMYGSITTVEILSFDMKQ